MISHFSLQSREEAIYIAQTLLDERIIIPKNQLSENSMEIKTIRGRKSQSLTDYLHLFEETSSYSFLKAQLMMEAYIRKHLPISLSLLMKSFSPQNSSSLVSPRARPSRSASSAYLKSSISSPHLRVYTSTSTPSTPIISPRRAKRKSLPSPLPESEANLITRSSESKLTRVRRASVTLRDKISLDRIAMNKSNRNSKELEESSSNNSSPETSKRDKEKLEYAKPFRRSRDKLDITRSPRNLTDSSSSSDGVSVSPRDVQRERSTSFLKLTAKKATVLIKENIRNVPEHLSPRRNSFFSKIREKKETDRKTKEEERIKTINSSECVVKSDEWSVNSDEGTAEREPSFGVWERDISRNGDNDSDEKKECDDKGELTVHEGKEINGKRGRKKSKERKDKERESKGGLGKEMSRRKLRKSTKERLVICELKETVEQPVQDTEDKLSILEGEVESKENGKKEKSKDKSKRRPSKERGSEKVVMMGTGNVTTLYIDKRDRTEEVGIVKAEDTEQQTNGKTRKSSKERSKGRKERDSENRKSLKKLKKNKKDKDKKNSIRSKKQRSKVDGEGERGDIGKESPRDLGASQEKGCESSDSSNDDERCTTTSWEGIATVESHNKLDSSSSGNGNNKINDNSGSSKGISDSVLLPCPDSGDALRTVKQIQMKLREKTQYPSSSSSQLPVSCRTSPPPHESENGTTAAATLSD